MYIKNNKVMTRKETTNTIKALQDRVRVIYSNLYGKEINEQFMPTTLEGLEGRLKYYSDNFQMI